MKKKIGITLFWLVIAAGFVFLFSYSTSPLYPTYYGNDSAQFQTIGKCWLKGAVPYRDLFDHKGPWIFFINMLGYLLTGTKYGIFLIQIVCMWISLYFLYKTAKYGLHRTGYALGTVLVSMFFLFLNYGEANLTEEYCLPFICASAYYIYVYFNEEYHQHSPRAAFLYGMAFCVCFYTRVTNCVLVAAGVLAITVSLIRYREFKNLWQNILGFLGGTLSVFLPFAVYFATQGALGDMLYGTLLYNLVYSKKITPWYMQANKDTYLLFIYIYFCAYSILLTAIWTALRKKWGLTGWFLIAGIIEMYLYINSTLFYHYPMVVLPQFIFLVIEIFPLATSLKCVKIKKASIVILLLFISYGIFYFKGWLGNIQKYRQSFDEGYYQILTYVPDDEKGLLMAYGDVRIKQIYLEYNIVPLYTHFSIQEWHASFDDNTKNQIHDEFAACKAKWILAEQPYDGIADILSEHYTLVVAESGYELYRLRDEGEEE